MASRNEEYVSLEKFDHGKLPSSLRLLLKTQSREKESARLPCRLTFVYTARSDQKTVRRSLFLFSRFAGQTVCRPSYFGCLDFMKVSKRQTCARASISAPRALLICVFIYNIVVWWTRDRINTSLGSVFLEASHPYSRRRRAWKMLAELQTGFPNWEARAGK
jgi:hypothetical protein